MIEYAYIPQIIILWTVSNFLLWNRPGKELSSPLTYVLNILTCHLSEFHDLAFILSSHLFCSLFCFPGIRMTLLYIVNTISSMHSLCHLSLTSPSHSFCPKGNESVFHSIMYKVSQSSFDKCFAEVKDFTKVSELLNTRVIEVKEEVHLFEKICPVIYLSWLSVRIRRMVCHRYMRGTIG